MIIRIGQWEVDEFVNEITVEESLEEISAVCNFKLVKPENVSVGLYQNVWVVDKDDMTNKNIVVFSGVIWETTQDYKGFLDIVAYDKTIYLAKSEDEYLFGDKTTATARIKKIAKDWNIPLSTIEETSIGLAKKLYRGQTLWQMMKDALDETVRKGGQMYRVRMLTNGLTLKKLGSNSYVYDLDTMVQAQLERTQSLEGTITKVKVLGKADDDKLAPVLANVSKNTSKYGTLQKIVYDENIKNYSQAKTVANSVLCEPQQVWSVEIVGIYDIHAGDKVKIKGQELLVLSVSYNLKARQMSLHLANSDYVRRRVYGYGSV